MVQLFASLLTLFKGVVALEADQFPPVGHPEKLV